MQASTSQLQQGGQEQQELRIAWQYKKYIESSSQGGGQLETGSVKRPTSVAGAALGALGVACGLTHTAALSQCLFEVVIPVDAMQPRATLSTVMVNSDLVRF